MLCLREEIVLGDHCQLHHMKIFEFPSVRIFSFLISQLRLNPQEVAGKCHCPVIIRGNISRLTVNIEAAGMLVT
ncbi:hypothetical protein INR49_031786 [Caranx melampygus]|nr:hypothetical protein INR49_031786 [Caranx melampygus]